MVIYVAIPGNSYVKKKEHKKLKTYPGLKKVLDVGSGLNSGVGDDQGGL